MYRTHTCGELSKKNIGEEVKLCGWVHRRRDHGGVVFIDLRDRYGLTQIVFRPEDKDIFKNAEDLRSEYVIQIQGKVLVRPEGQEKKDMATGDVEVEVNGLKIFSKAKTPPFEIDQEKDVKEEVRLEYRYLDLRKERMQRNMAIRHQMAQLTRKFWSDRGFLEIETPDLVKGTPEGAREYLVPARLHPGKFYVLPQSPQQFKQLLMVAGFDKYFQIARCFRDEDQRGDRQPEFTQLDVEMSFAEEEDIMQLTEDWLKMLTEEVVPHKKIKFTPFLRMTWQEAMDRYGSDKPDMRFDMPIVDVTTEVKGCDFKVFAQAPLVRALRVEGGAKFTRSEIDELTELAKTKGAKGLAYIVVGDELKSPILKFLKDEQVKTILDRVGAKKGDIVFFGADEFQVVCGALGAVRLACGDKINLKATDELAYVWVTEFPMFSISDIDGKISAEHHPFTMPMEEDIPLLDQPDKLFRIRSHAYDIVLNGSEIGGGSIRIYDPKLQSKVFETIGVSGADAQRRFGHMLRAFEYGVPPHGGIAPGFDRIVMLFCDEPDIREVMAFPKNQQAEDLMLGAPSEMPAAQVAEANVKIIEQKKP